MSVRAFDLVPAIERQKLMLDKVGIEISCLECCGKNLYIGTEDCYVIHYVVEEKSGSPGGKTSYISEKQGQKYLGLKKPISQLQAASALNRILVLCDNLLTLLNMFDLEPVVSGAKIKNVTSFCLNNNPVKSNPYSIEICVALKKKNLQIYSVTEDKVSLLRDVSTQEPPLAMSIDGTIVCVAFSSEYCIINYSTGNVQQLFSFINGHIVPIVTRITREEFLLTAHGALGQFATASGISQRPPLQWSENIISVVYNHPYCLALNDEFVTVHSILDQQQKQSIPFQGGQCLGEFDGKLFVASSKEVYSLVPIPVEKQIQALLLDKRVKEALELTKNARKTGLSKEKFLRMYNRIQQQAGFIEFSEMHFDECRQLFESGQLDVRELVTLYPHLLASGSEFTRSVPPLHEIADVIQLTQGQEDKVLDYKRFLLAYLEEVRGTKQALGCQKEIDTALLKLYAELSPKELLQTVSIPLVADPADCLPWLEKFGRFHALGLLQSTYGDHDKALEIWTRLSNGELQDDSFPGFEFIVAYLAKLKSIDLLWKYVDWVLERNEPLGVQIFIEQDMSSYGREKLQPDLVVDYLARYPTAVISYLQYLVFQRKFEKEKYHTHLSVLYLDRVLRMIDSPDTSASDLESARAELRHMLQYSNLYRVQLLLGKVKDREMYPECAILYGKMEEHDKALGILVHKLRNFHAAEEYCLVNSKGKDISHRKRLFHSLLSVYLDPNNDEERRDSLVVPAVALLNNNKADFDTVKVLHLLPDHWSIGLLSQFLTSSIRKGLNSYRTTHIERMLARGENLQFKGHRMELERVSVQLTEDKICAICSKGFSEPTLVRYPNDVLAHVHCAKNKFVCPITGKLFRAKPSQSPPPADQNDTVR